MLKERLSNHVEREHMLITCNASGKEMCDFSVVQGLPLLPWGPAIIYMQETQVQVASLPITFASHREFLLISYLSRQLCYLFLE